MTIKNLLSALLLGTAATALQAQTATPAEALRSRLQQVAGKGCFAFGHHDDTAYGHTWCGEAGRSDVKEVCGDYPGVMNWDLGLIEWQRDKELDGVPFATLRSEAAAQHARGGINTYSWHVRNPLTRGDSWDVSGGTDVLAQSLTPGTAAHDTLCVWIARAADFLGSLRTRQGGRLPVVFRPWHEHTGGWFWWGAPYCTPAQYKQLWQLTRRIFSERGADNVLWAYSPDVVSGKAEYLERYPGDDYVDIMGADVYHRDGEAGTATYRHKLANTLGAATEAARERGKLVALTETGSEGLPMPQWWTRVLLPACARYPISYVCVWRNAHDMPGHFYAPWPGQASAKDFQLFHRDKRTLFSKELKQIKPENKY